MYGGLGLDLGRELNRKPPKYRMQCVHAFDNDGELAKRNGGHVLIELLKWQDNKKRGGDLSYAFQ